MSRLRPAFSGGLSLRWREPPRGDSTIRQMPFAPALFLPLRQHAGDPSVPVVHEGEDVVRGQLLARPDGDGGLPLHAPATGEVISIAERADRAGRTVLVIQLAPSAGDTQEYPGGAGCDPESTRPDEMLELIRDAGVVDLGGGARAMHARLQRARADGTSMLVLNGIDSDPGLSDAAPVLQGLEQDLRRGARCLARILGARRVVLVVEEPDGEAARALVGTFTPETGPELQVLPPRYPQGAEPLLLRRVFGGSAKRGGSEAAPGALSISIATAAEVGRLLADGLAMTDQVVTLGGGGLADPGHYRTPLGTPLQFALEHAGMCPAPASVLQGGMMRGEALASLAQPVTKGVTGYLALAEDEMPADVPALPCIRCGECIAACPVQLNPAELGLLARRQDYKKMNEKYALKACIECGCCSYACPSHIPLLQLFRAAKAQSRRRSVGMAAGGAR